MDSSRVVIATIQRVYSMLKGEPDLDPAAELASQFETSGAGMSEPLPVVYNATFPPEYFDVVVIDEVHRSIYTLWRQVVEYFDAFLVGLTATPSQQTLGFFNKNLVMEYDHERAVADGVNVDFEVYKIRTKITEGGSSVEAHPDTMLGYRNRQTRALRWEKPDEDLTGGAIDLHRSRSYARGGRLCGVDQAGLAVSTEVGVKGWRTSGVALMAPSADGPR
jgi:type I restriction enzyme R subunit